MKIGIDAKWYISGNPSGKVVVENLVNELITLDLQYEIILFLQRKDKSNAHILEEKCKNKSHIKIVYCISSVNFLSNIFIVPFYAKKHKVDFCLYQNYTPFLFKDKIKNITYIHDFLFLDYPQYYSLVERLVFRLMCVTARFAKKIITISESEKDRILKYTKIDSKNIEVVYHGVSEDFSPDNSQNEISLKLPEKYILFLGRINVRKNIQLLLSALPQIDEKYSLVIVGKKDHKTFNIDKYIIDLGIEKRVMLLGHVSYKDLLIILSKAKIFVFPSFAEGFGLPPIEAMKSGVPVVTSNATCLPEVCGDAALFFNPNDKYELADKVNMLGSKILYESMKIKGIEKAKEFNWTKSAYKILDIIKNM